MIRIQDNVNKEFVLSKVDDSVIYCSIEQDLKWDKIWTWQDRTPD
jgi:hypothetical protein